MKKISLIICVLCFTFAPISIAENWYKNGTEKMLAESKPNQTCQINENLKVFEGEQAGRNYSDVVAFGLKGKVKSCEVFKIKSNPLDGRTIYNDNDVESIHSEAVFSAMIDTMTSPEEILSYGESVEKNSFTANGKYIPKNGETATYEGNVLSKIKTDAKRVSFEYEKGRLKSRTEFLENFDMLSMYNYEYTYNNLGVPEKEEEFEDFDLESDVTTYYRHYTFDSHGNWTTRICKVGVLRWGEVRIIKYY